MGTQLARAGRRVPPVAPPAAGFRVDRTNLLDVATGKAGPSVSHTFLGDFARFLFHEQRVPSAGTITSYLHEVASFCETQGLPRPPFPAHLRTALQREAQLHPFDDSKDPAPVHLVQHILHDTAIPLVFRAATATLWFGTFRGTEVMPDKVYSYDRLALTRSDVAFEAGGSFVRFALKRGKAMTANEPSVRLVTKPTDPGAFNPVALLHEFASASAHLPADGPFFRHPDGRNATLQQLRDHIKTAAATLGLDPAKYGVHSLRSGGNTMMWAHEVPQGTIGLQGGWQSAGGDAPYRRVNVTQSRRAQAALRVPAAPLDPAAPTLPSSVTFVSASSPLLPAPAVVMPA